MLELKNLTKQFHKNTPDAKTVLDDFSLSVAEGDFITILGGNGAGKSTLFNAICGNTQLDSGVILLDGEDITYQKEYKRAKTIGRLFQNPLLGTAPSMTIEENLLLASHHEKKGSQLREIVATLELGLENRMKTKVGLLSGGQRQALTLLMGLIIPPKLLLLDEHTAALDPLTAEKILKLTKQMIAKDHLTTLMITHDLNAALALGNRTILLYNGKIAVDLQGEERDHITIPQLLSLYTQNTHTELSSDRILLSAI